MRFLSLHRHGHILNRRFFFKVIYLRNGTQGAMKQKHELTPSQVYKNIGKCYCWYTKKLQFCRDYPWNFPSCYQLWSHQLFWSGKSLSNRLVVLCWLKIYMIYWLYCSIGQSFRIKTCMHSEFSLFYCFV